jgi:protocatechuate 3,4-dioxygenase, alpha subunit
MTDPQKTAGTKPSGITPSQTVGPYFAYCLTPREYDGRELATGDLITQDAVGARIRIDGVVYDGDGAPVPDAFVEIWQADGEGRYAHPKGGLPGNAEFKGFGRTECDGAGRFSFTTVKPGPVPGPNGVAQAPHLNVGLFARGVLRRLFTRVYFADEAGNAADPVLALVPEDRRYTLIARKDGASSYRFDIRIQGDHETVFFET